MTEPIELRTVFLDPVRAEVLVEVAWPLAPGDDIRGKLVGPQCRFASTIEIAYPVKRRADGRYHVVIPEPSRWEPQTPFVYEARIEWWRSGKRIEQTRMLHGLLNVTKAGDSYRLNGKPFTLRPAEDAGALSSDWLKLRDAGYNALQVDSAADFPCDEAARLGFFVQSADRQPVKSAFNLWLDDMTVRDSAGS